MKTIYLVFIGLCLTVLLQAQVSKMAHVSAGNLKTALTTDEINTVTNLTLTGTIDARDFKTMRDNMPALAELDLSEVIIANYQGEQGTGGNDYIFYEENEIPLWAFFDRFLENGKVGLTSVRLPLNTTGIGNVAFARCENLTLADIPSTVTSIGDYAFVECPNLSAVNIPSGLISIGINAFYGSGGMVTVEEGNAHFSAQEGVLFDKNFLTILHCPVSKIGSFIVPSSVSSIGDFSFFGCSNLTSVTIPSSVTSIGDYAFYACSGLASLVVNSTYPYEIMEDNSIFMGVNKPVCILYVPYGSKKLYAAAPEWKEFTNIVEEPNGFILSSIFLKLAANEGSSNTVNVSANVAWTVSSDQTWLTVNPTSGSGNQRVTFTAQANTSVLSRSANISFAATGFASQILTVKQEGLSKIINVSPGGLFTALTAQELGGVSHLALTGRIDARDFKILRDQMPNLEVLDLGGVRVVEYSGTEGTNGDYQSTYAGNEIPQNAFSDPFFHQGKTSLTRINLPGSIISIGPAAFFNCNKLTSINIPFGVTSIGYSAFSTCSSLTSVTIPSSVFMIESSAFYKCSAPLLVEPDNSSYSSLDGVLFNKERSNLIHCPTSKTGNYSIPSSVIVIENEAFESCENLSSIVIPASVTSFGYSAFNNCSALFSVNSGNPNFSSLDGVLFNKDKTSLLKFPVSISGNYSVPSTVAIIAPSAFAGCSRLTSVAIPSSVTSIGEYSFGNCSGLTSMHVNLSYPPDFSNTYNVFYGVNQAFCILHVPYGSSELYSATPQWKEFKTIIEDANGFFLSSIFMKFTSEGGSDSSVNIKANVGWTAISDQPWLMVTPPTGMGNIGLTLTAGANPSVEQRTAKVTVSATGENSQTITIFQEGLPKTITVTAGGLLEGLTASELKGITNLTVTGTIDARDFKTIRDQLSQLLVLDLSGARIAAYNGTGGTSEYERAYGANEVPVFAFFDPTHYTKNSTLTTVVLPMSVTSIGESAFYFCSGLTSLIIPPWVTSIGSAAFAYCSGLTSIIANPRHPVDLVASYLVFEGIDQTTCTLNVPYGSKELYANAFQWMDFSQIVEDSEGFKLSSTNLYLPSEGGESAGLDILANVAWTLGSNQTWLRVDPAFGTGNQTITFLSEANPSVARRTALVTVSATGENSQIFTVYQEGLTKTINLTAGGLRMALTASEREGITHLTVTGMIDARDFKTMRDEMPLLSVLNLSGATIAAYTGTQGTGYENVYRAHEVPYFAFFNYFTGIAKTSLISVELPLSATAINDAAFQSCTGITSLTVPPLVTSIGYSVFLGCSALTAVTIPQTVMYIRPFAFGNCIALTSVSLPPMLRSLEAGSFSGCSSLTSILIPSLVDSIENNAFSGCSGLTTVTLPLSLISIGNHAFSSCSALTSVSLPSSLTSLGEGAFYWCSRLTSITLPSSITSIKRDIFYGCTSLTSVFISGSVISIGDHAFFDCSALASVIIPSTVSYIGETAFSGCSSLTTIAIPSSVIFIGSGAFSNCSGLRSIVAHSSYPVELTDYPGVFSGINKNTCGLNVPYKARELYALADQWKDFTNITEQTEGFLLDKSVLHYSAMGGSEVVNSTANVTWEASSDQAWLIVTPNAGTGMQTLTLTAEANQTAAVRTAKVTVAALVAGSQILTITQEGLPKTITVHAGGLLSALTVNELNGNTHLILSGTIDARDFKTMRDHMPLLAVLDLSRARIAAYSGAEGTIQYENDYPADQIPLFAFFDPYSYTGKTSLSSVILPSTITSIANDAFNQCSGLITVTIPESVTIIGSAAFMNCSGLTSIFANSPYPVDLTPTYSVFEGIDKTYCTLHVPIGSGALYAAAFQWQDFFNIVEKPVEVNKIEQPMVKLKFYPNPFTQEVTIEIQNPKRTKVTVDIYTMDGQMVNNLIIGNTAEHMSLKWDGTNEQGKHITPGVYICKVNDQTLKLVYGKK